MQLTILADKLPDMTTEQFVHEFRVVHAHETKAMAMTLGIISQYVQGLILTTAQQEKLLDQPLPEPDEPFQSFAQLTWPALEVMQGSFTTQGYKESAGKHIFATPRKIFLTERLEPNLASIKVGSPVRLVCCLVPPDGTGTDFRSSWDEHAKFCRSICQHYQRNQVMHLEPERIKKIFDGTQFPDSAVAQSGGFEEFLFESNAEDQTFCANYGEKLKSSYLGFASPKSFCLGFDIVVWHDDNDRGYQQIFAGAFISTVLRAKVFLGV